MKLLRSLLLSALLVIVAFVVFSYLSGTGWLGRPGGGPRPAIDTAGGIDTARERGAEVGEKVAIAAAKMKETAAEAALTSKIKAKMVLDDNINARAIDVTTER